MTSLALLRPIRVPLISAMLLQAVAAIAALLPLLALIAFTSAWLTGDDVPGVGVVVAAVAGTIGSALAASLATWITHRADAHLAWQLQRELADTVRHIPLPEVTGTGAARIRKVVQDDTGSLHYLVAHTLLDATLLTVTPVAGFVALAVVDWRLALLSLVPLALGIHWYVRAMRGSGANFADYASWQRRIGSTVVDYVRGLPVAKIYGGPGSSQARYEDAVTGFHAFFRSWSGATANVTTASWLVVTPALTTGLFALVGGAGLLAGRVSPEALIAGVVLGPAISAPVAVAGPRLQAIRTGLAALASITEFLEQPQLTWGDRRPPTGAVPALEGVSAHYGEKVALDDVTLQLPERGFIALVGASGSGKSTLAHLLARFADPDTGRILLGGIDYRQLREAELYQRVGFVFQDTHLPDAPIRDILAGGRPIPDEGLRAATAPAAIDEVIAALPDGYDTILGDDTELSGGQRQRLALARALLRKPDLLVLDEALSALDPATRTTILRTLTEQARERTVLLIAHQLHLTRDADRILVLDDGKLVGDGTHDRLLECCPAYRALWHAQTLSASDEGSH
ncbi:ABC transporter ATP-binding protein [Microbacterium sp.]|uniref:ABC transporter ATP-binding protein n=1 Tax=Microbacterium sp. TaxID=51671 RepID=UPI003F9E4544